MSNNNVNNLISVDFFDSFTFGVQTALLIEAVHSLRYTKASFASLKQRYFLLLTLAAFFNWLHGLMVMGFGRWYDLFNSGLMLMCMLNITVYMGLYYGAVLDRFAVLSTSMPRVKPMIYVAWVLFFIGQIYNDVFWMYYGKNMELWAQLYKAQALHIVINGVIDLTVSATFLRGMYARLELKNGERKLTPLAWHFLISNVLIICLTVFHVSMVFSPWIPSQSTIENLLAMLKIRIEFTLVSAINKIFASGDSDDKIKGSSHNLKSVSLNNVSRGLSTGSIDKVGRTTSREGSSNNLAVD